MSDLLSSPATAVSLIIALILVAIVLSVRKKSTTTGSNVLLVGPSDGGKTAILSSLIYQTALPTHTSLQINLATLSLPSSKTPLKLVDVPGHPRIRGQFREYLADAKAVVFVVDVSALARNGAAVAEHLHILLHAITSLPPSQKAPQLLIWANKADLLQSTPVTNSTNLAITRARTILERELSKRRSSHSRSVGVEMMGDEDNGEMGGLEGGKQGFRFDEWEGGEVDVLGGWVDGSHDEDGEKSHLGEDGLSRLKEWLEGL